MALVNARGSHAVHHRIYVWTPGRPDGPCCAMSDLLVKPLPERVKRLEKAGVTFMGGICWGASQDLGTTPVGDLQTLLE